MRAGSTGPFWVALSLFAMTLLPACDDPQAPVAPETDSTGSYDPGDGTLEFEIRSPDGGRTNLRLVARDVRFDAATSRVHADVGILNAGTETVVGPRGVVVSDFRPLNVQPANADFCGERLCAYRYEGSYGSDGLLEPGEISDLREWIFLNPDGQGFAFRVQLQQPESSGVIAGTVFDDRNGNGRRDATEPGLPDREVTAVGPDGPHKALTDARGFYVIAVSQAGLYHVAKTPHARGEPTPRPYEVVIIQLPDGSLSSFRGADFACHVPSEEHGIPVTGVVYHDLDRNGERGPDEPGVAGFLVTAAAAQCPTFVPIEDVSDERGRFAMRLPECVPPYEVWLAVQDGYTATTPIHFVFEDSLGADGVLHVEFGVVMENASLVIAGHVFWDNNGNGHRDRGEPGIEDVELAFRPLMCVHVPELPTLRTNSNGGYKWRFDATDPCMALFWLEHEPIIGTVDTTPNPFLVAAPPGGNAEMIVDFGVQRIEPQ